MGRLKPRLFTLPGPELVSAPARGYKTADLHGGRMSKPIYVLNGPNLNLLGTREPEIYGRATLADVQALCEQRARAAGTDVVFRQTNHEGVLIDWVQEAREKASALVLNPAGYGHTSVALLDALKALSIPVIECHLSNPAARESFRHTSFVSPVATGTITGFGSLSYELAVDAALRLISSTSTGASRPA
jgi:3-dehydroquinate dehydratase-2